eukprot:1188263-Prorocentrum_minimum.AAC.1
MVYWVGTRRREHGRNECARSDQSPPGWSRANSMMTGVIQYNSNFSTSYKSEGQRCAHSPCPGVDGQKGLRLQFNSRQSSTVDTNCHTAGRQSTPGLGIHPTVWRKHDRMAAAGQDDWLTSALHNQEVQAQHRAIGPP